VKHENKRYIVYKKDSRQHSVQLSYRIIRISYVFVQVMIFFDLT